jgi:outer membrane immunogenic protein
MRKMISVGLLAFAGLTASTGSGTAATLDDVMAQLQSIQRDNQAIRRDNEAMRKELAALRRSNVQATHQASLPVSAADRALPQNVSTAMAATGPLSRNYSAAPVARGYDWSGFYIGAHGGYALDKLDASDVSNTVPGPPVTMTSNIYSRLHTGFGGLQAGYNWQFGNWLVGAEADGSFGRFNTKSTTTDSIGGVGSSLSVVQGDRYSLDWLMTVRGRAGFAYNNWLAYGTGGVAVARATLQSSSTATFTNFVPFPDGSYSSSSTKSEVLAGWTAGGGVEVGVTDAISFKSEYLYVSLPDMSLSFPGPNAGGNGSVPNNRAQGVAFHTFRSGLNYRF